MVVNRKRSEILDALLDVIIFHNPVNRVDLPELSGLSEKTVSEWVDLILRIQAMPVLEISEEETGEVFIRLNMPSPEEARLENAMAFLSMSGVRDDVVVDDER